MTSDLAAPEAGAVAEPAPAPARRGHRILAALLIIIGAVLTPITIVALFAHTQLTDSDRYVQNVSPLASNPAIQTYVADTMSHRLLARLDEHKYIQSLLPPRAQPLVGPMRSAFDGFVRATALKVVQSDQFQKLWDQANRIAHNQVQYVLTGKSSGVITSKNGAVTIDLTALLNRIIVQLQNSGISAFNRIPIVAVPRQITIFQSEDLSKIRNAMNVFDKIAYVMPFLVFACFGGGILLARNRRRGFLWSAIGFAIGALVLAAGLTIGRNLYLNALNGKGIPHDAGAAMFDTVVRFLHTSVRTALIFSIIVIVAVIFAGPSRLARWFRTRTHKTVDWLGAESDRAGWRWLGPFGGIAHHKGAWRAGIAVVLFVVVFRWPHPTPVVVFWLAILALGLLALVEYFGRERDAPVNRPPLPTAGAAD